MIPTDGAKAFIINSKDNKFLLVLRDNVPNIPNPNCWSLLGGGIEQGEKPVDALKREILEETNIEIYNIKQIDTIDVLLTVNDKQYTVTGYIFFAHTDAKLSDIKIYEGQKVGYFTYDEIKNMKNIAPGALSLIEKYEKLFKSRI
ncbi:MAG: NUDIX domain-containing protein [Candidatus Falkowbacteria bacterium]